MATSRRYTLLPLEDTLVAAGNGAGPAAGPPKLRRYRLARLAPSPRSATGVDRHERLEQVAAAQVANGAARAGRGQRGSDGAMMR